MTWMVTGGAGYIGAHVARAFAADGLDVVVFDDLSSGHRGFAPAGATFVQGTLLDEDLLAQTCQEYAVTGVVHLAGFKYAGVSVQRPLHTYEQNVTAMIYLLRAMEKSGVDQMVFSSSAATFGTPDTALVTEQNPTLPESPYGESKLIGEWLLRDQAAVSGLRHTALRYFNVVGSGTDEIYDSSPHNLFPLVFEALLEGRTPRIYGDDYDTEDGTCVRDYVHVQDIALAHVEAAKALQAGRKLEPVYNLGSGTGLSVRQIMEAMARVTGIDFAPEVGPRRPGDPARIVATGELAARDLGWRMRHDVDAMVSSGWSARQAASQHSGN